MNYIMRMEHVISTQVDIFIKYSTYTRNAQSTQVDIFIMHYHTIAIHILLIYTSRYFYNVLIVFNRVLRVEIYISRYFHNVLSARVPGTYNRSTQVDIFVKYASVYVSIYISRYFLQSIFAHLL